MAERNTIPKDVADEESDAFAPANKEEVQRKEGR